MGTFAKSVNNILAFGLVQHQRDVSIGIVRNLDRNAILRNNERVGKSPHSNSYQFMQVAEWFYILFDDVVCNLQITR